MIVKRSQKSFATTESLKQALCRGTCLLLAGAGQESHAGRGACSDVKKSGVESVPPPAAFTASDRARHARDCAPAVVPAAPRAAALPVPMQAMQRQHRSPHAGGMKKQRCLARGSCVGHASRGAGHAEHHPAGAATTSAVGAHVASAAATAADRSSHCRQRRHTCRAQRRALAAAACWRVRACSGENTSLVRAVSARHLGQQQPQPKRALAPVGARPRRKRLCTVCGCSASASEANPA